MKFKVTIPYPRAVEDTLAMLQDQRFHSIRDRKLSASTSPVQNTSGGFKFTTSSDVDLQQAPAAVRKLVKGSNLGVQVVEEWDTTAATATTTAEVSGAPVSLHFTSRLLPATQGCERVLEGEVKVRIPLVGGAIEKQALGYIYRVKEFEGECAQEYWSQEGQENE
ncbi:MAG: DUF2505 domain-containing protein [Actinomycetaceae bacterium]|nr:DUF2505 domain-containing protein [Actinomycetaceae bacterium]